MRMSNSTQDALLNGGAWGLVVTGAAALCAPGAFDPSTPIGFKNCALLFVAGALSAVWNLYKQPPQD